MNSLQANSDAKIAEKYLILTFLNSRRYFIFIGVVIGVLIAILVNNFVLNRPYTYQGSIIYPASPAPDFVINDQNGITFKLSQQTGNVVLLFFGYTHCPDVCPVTMSQYKQIRNQLGEQALSVRFVFVTVDPERDTPGAIKEYLSHFDPAIIGLSDDRSTLEKVWQAYSVIQERSEVSMANGYMVDHTSRVYVIDKAGLLRMTYPFGFDIEKIVQDIDHLLREDEG